MSSTPLAADLLARADQGRPVTVGLAGTGQMGTDIICQIEQMPGLRLGAVAELRADMAGAAAAIAGIDGERTSVAANAADVDRTIEAGRLAIVEDAMLLAESGRVDVVIDATGNPNFGADLTLKAIGGGKHIVMMNVECDVTIGRHLAGEARQAGVVYTGAAGDEPAATIELIEFAKNLGMTVVAAGKGKNNPLNIDATPDLYVNEARARAMNARMLVEFVDGSKTMIEMVAIANATGLVPDIPGMHGPEAGLAELASVLCLAEDGGVLSRKGVVDYSIGKGVAPGVFCIVEMNHPRLTERMIDLKVGEGPYFPLYRPYHLTSMEVPLSAARAVLYGKADMVPLDRPIAEVGALAKKDLAVGERLDKIGEYGYRGFALEAADAGERGALPLGLAEGAMVTTPVRKGELLTCANCTPNADLTITRLRQRQDQADGQY
ncbi:MAG: NAD(P)H-dependent oxidoreductase [Geminicoccaceae bacterium]